MVSARPTSNDTLTKPASIDRPVPKTPEIMRCTSAYAHLAAADRNRRLWSRVRNWSFLPVAPQYAHHNVAVEASRSPSTLKYRRHSGHFLPAVPSDDTGIGTVSCTESGPTLFALTVATKPRSPLARSLRKWTTQIHADRATPRQHQGRH